MLDRRVQRTKQLLHKALVQLIKERGYDTVTIQDITERANLGRTTFYLHYESKEDLLLDHHAEMSTRFSVGILSRGALLGDAPQPEVIEYLELLGSSRQMYQTIRSAKLSEYVIRAIREQIKANLQNSLHDIFPDSAPKMPLDVLTEYVVGAQESLIHWWMTERNPYSAVQLATMLHQLQQSVICDAYRVLT